MLYAHETNTKIRPIKYFSVSDRTGYHNLNGVCLRKLELREKKKNQKPLKW